MSHFWLIKLSIIWDLRHIKPLLGFFRSQWSILWSTNWTGHITVCFFIDLQKQGCCELVFGLMVNPKPSKLPQDQVQMTLRSEVLLNEIKNEFRRCKQKEDLRIGAWYSGCPETQNGFLLQSNTPLNFIPPSLSEWKM